MSAVRFSYGADLIAKPGQTLFYLFCVPVFVITGLHFTGLSWRRRTVPNVRVLSNGIVTDGICGLVRKPVVVQLLVGQVSLAYLSLQSTKIFPRLARLEPDVVGGFGDSIASSLVNAQKFANQVDS